MEGGLKSQVSFLDFSWADLVGQIRPSLAPLWALCVRGFGKRGTISESDAFTSTTKQRMIPNRFHVFSQRLFLLNCVDTLVQRWSPAYLQHDLAVLNSAGKESSEATQVVRQNLSHPPTPGTAMPASGRWGTLQVQLSSAAAARKTISHYLLRRACQQIQILDADIHLCCCCIVWFVSCV